MRKEIFKQQPKWVDLENLLIAAHPGPISYTFEEDLDKIIQRGKSFSSVGSRMERGDPSQCHWNTAALYEANSDAGFKIVTGWAFTKNVGWVQHTWGTFKGKVIETTEKRDGYFGFELNKEESENFVYDNM